MSKRSEITEEILKFILIGGGIILASTSPYFGASLAKAFLKHYQNKNKIKTAARRFNELYKRRIITYEELPDGQTKIVLTKEGQILTLKYQFSQMKLKRQNKWDDHWHILIYDIPNKNKGARDALRAKMVNFGLFPLQKSILVAPFSFRDEIEFICAIYNLKLDQDIFYFVTKDIPKAPELKSWFKI